MFKLAIKESLDRKFKETSDKRQRDASADISGFLNSPSTAAPQHCP
jgi:hypothetical protein